MRGLEFADHMVEESRQGGGGMAESSVLVDLQGATCTITLNRPQALNAFTAAMHGELMAALEGAAANTAVRAVIITGAGRGFCAGQDLTDPAMAGQAGADAPDVGGLIERFYAPLAQRLLTMPVPVVAAVNGVAAGAGANFALSCDIVFAARSGSFIQAFSKIGLVPDAGGSWLLPRLVGRGRALGLAMTGDRLSGEDAERIGLIWKCVGDAALMDCARAMARQLGALPTRALVETRRVIDASMQLSLPEAVLLEAGAQRELGRSHDFAEGVAAFLAKRPPVFKDR